jgi:hypothetical protein
MSSGKKDLTRIEDLGEFIHELSVEDELNSEELPSELPDLPSSDDEDSFPSFSSNDEDPTSGLDFGTTEEFPTTDFESDANNFSTTFSDEEESLSEMPKEEFKMESLEEQEDETSWKIDVPVSEDLEDKEETTFLLEPETEKAAQDPLSASSAALTAKGSEYKSPETFDDIKKFSESSSFSAMATEGNPSFSVLLKNVRYLEDIQDIITLLRELNLLVDPEEQVKARLMRGMLLVPRISEYAAIFLAHKLRRFDIDIEVGLSDEIHRPKHQEAPETGIVSRHSLYQNQSHHFHFDDPKLEISQIIVSATSTLEGYQVVKYLGVASEHKMLESHVVEDENSPEVPIHYQELAQKLKAHALKANSNAVVGLNYQLTPLPSEFGMGGHKYRLTCTGNLVWVNKL